MALQRLDTPAGMKTHRIQLSQMTSEAFRVPIQKRVAKPRG
jgi:hypothetical protein